MITVLNILGLHDDQIEDSKEFSLVTNRKFRIDILDPMKTTIVSMQQNKLDPFQYVFFKEHIIR